MQNRGLRPGLSGASGTRVVGRALRRSGAPLSVPSRGPGRLALPLHAVLLLQAHAATPGDACKSRKSNSTPCHTLQVCSSARAIFANGWFGGAAASAANCTSAASCPPESAAAVLAIARTLMEMANDEYARNKSEGSLPPAIWQQEFGIQRRAATSIVSYSVQTLRTHAPAGLLARLVSLHQIIPLQRMQSGHANGAREA